MLLLLLPAGPLAGASGATGLGSARLTAGGEDTGPAFTAPGPRQAARNVRLAVVRVSVTRTGLDVYLVPSS